MGKLPTTPTFIRWISYVDLTVAQLVLVKALDYTKETWNLLGTNPIEESIFYFLTSDQQDAAEQLGFVEDTWDCYQNHYDGYTWSELEEVKVAKYWIELGWNQLSWDEDIDPLNIFDMKWVELTPAQQEAATELCYRQGTWDKIPIPEWPVSPDPDNVPSKVLSNVPSKEQSGVPSDTPSVRPSESLSDSPTTDAPTLSPTSSKPVSSASPSRAQSNVPSKTPSDVPSDTPSVRPSESLSDSPTTDAPTLSPTS